MLWIIGGVIFVIAILGIANGDIDFDDGCVCEEGRSYECSDCADKIKAES